MRAWGARRKRMEALLWQARSKPWKQEEISGLFCSGRRRKLYRSVFGQFPTTSSPVLVSVSDNNRLDQRKKPRPKRIFLASTFVIVGPSIRRGAIALHARKVPTVVLL